MSEVIVHQSDPNSSEFKNPKLGWMIGFLFVVSFLGLFSLVPLRKVIFYSTNLCIFAVFHNFYMQRSNFELIPR